MYQETQSELFIRLLTEFLNDLRVQQLGRQRERHAAESDRNLSRFGMFTNSTEQPARFGARHS